MILEVEHFAALSHLKEQYYIGAQDPQVSGELVLMFHHMSRIRVFFICFVE